MGAWSLLELTDIGLAWQQRQSVFVYARRKDAPDLGAEELILENASPAILSKLARPLREARLHPVHRHAM